MENEILELERWAGTLADAVARVATGVLEWLPNLVGAILLLLLGWLAARLLSGLVQHLADRALRRLERTKLVRSRVQGSAAFQSVPMIAGRLVYWTIVLFSVAAAVEAMGLAAVSRAIAQITVFLPRVFAAIGVLVAGYVLGELAKVFLGRVLADSGVRAADTVARIGQVLILIVAAVLAVDQLGVDSTILVTIIVTILAGVFGAAALAFGLGARATVSNIIAAHYVRWSYDPGDRIRIGNEEGTITEITRTGVVMITDEGRVFVPACRFDLERSILLTNTSNSEPAGPAGL